MVEGGLCSVDGTPAKASSLGEYPGHLGIQNVVSQGLEHPGPSLFFFSFQHVYPVTLECDSATKNSFINTKLTNCAAIQFI